jgi:O-antigen ligase
MTGAQPTYLQPSTRAAAPAVGPLSQPVSGLATAAALLALAYLVVAYGRLAETFFRVPYLAMITGSLGLIVSALSGSLVRAANFPSGRILLALSSWIILCIPFSVWRGGSFELLTEMYIKSVALYLLIAGNLTVFKHYRWVCNAIVAALIALVLATRYFGTMRDGRFALGLGALGNPNDFAMHLLIATPFLLLLVDVKGLKSIWSWLALGMTGTILMLVLKTGSRAGLLTMGVFIMYRFIRGSIRTKALLVVLAIFAIAAAPVFVSPQAMERYLVFVGRLSTEDASSRQASYAEGSQAQRTFLLKQSLIATATHPLFGVGPGNFGPYLAEVTRDLGMREAWSQTHNSFTQMSAECGLVGGVLYLLLVIRAFRNGKFVWKACKRNPKHRNLSAAGEALVAAVLCFCAGAFFGNYAYMLYAPLLAGCGEALRHIAEQELAAVPVAKPRPAV